MMKTPICDFVRRYANSDVLRLHMPGHKGEERQGCEPYDLTEVKGADSLYDADGIIRESEKNASELFGCDTFFSTEGSSLCIRAMLLLLRQYATEMGREPLILAGRNAHKTFLSGMSLLDLDVEWLCGEGDSYLACDIRADRLEERLLSMKKLPVAVYLTAPDYLGNNVDWDAISAVCHRHGVLLAVDCAHGAYLRFLTPSRYPTDHGADLCCSSAHKTLPVLTGGAYLHVAKNAPKCFSDRAKDAMAMFGSTSPSYLILQSLDGANAILSGSYPEDLAAFAEQVAHLRAEAEKLGYVFVGNEPMKVTIKSKEYGYLGTDYAALLRERGIECEFADPDFVVLMLTPDIGEVGVARLWNAMQTIPRREVIAVTPPKVRHGERIMSPREAMLAPSELLEIERCEGRILASASVGCPPAVPIAVCGERLDGDAIRAFAYYGIERIRVVK